MSFTYDELNRVATAQSQATSGANCWGNSFAYDIWANLLSKTVTKCTAETLTVAVNTNNRITNTGFAYDAAGNLTNSGSGVMTYDAGNRLSSVAGVTYIYDPAGRRAQKSNGKIYFYGLDGEVLAEGPLGGPISTVYVHFGGKRIARRDLATNTVSYYFSDHLGSASVVTSATGVILDESDYYPFGGERVITNSDPNQYKFTGKERDPESGLDYFGARYYTASLGRFTIPDPLLNSGRPWQPQSWNRYAYVLNNPARLTDPAGLYEWWDAGMGCSTENDSTCDRRTLKRIEQWKKNFREALKQLAKARDKFERGSQEYNRLDAALKAYGKEGEANGVTVGFGALKGDAAAETTPLNNNTAWSVTFDTSKLGSSGEWASAAGHEGTHLDDFSALNQNPAGFMNVLTPFSLEYRGYETGVFTARGLGFDTYKSGNNILWNSSWKEVDKQTLMDKGITDTVKQVYGHQETQPHNPLPN